LDIRSSTDSDRKAIRDVHSDAFGAEDGPEIVDLVDGLFEDPTARPYLSLVAESGRLVVGHILFTVVRIHSVNGEKSARILAPLGVVRQCQDQGVGGRLVDEGLRQLGESGVGLVFVLGHPGYYPRFGFEPAGALGLHAPYPIPSENADAWMMKSLKPGVVTGVQGTVECASVLNHPEHWRE